MAVVPFSQNMGLADRIVRGALGGMFLANGLAHIAGGSRLRWLESGIGGAFLLYGITGFDPLLKLFGASTIPGTENNVLNRLKQVAPGQGINPILTQQAIPKTPIIRQFEPGQPIAQVLAIR